MAINEKTLSQLQKEVNNSLKKLCLFIFIFLILFTILVVCIYNIAKLVTFYFSQRQTLRESFKNKSNNPNNKNDDNELIMGVDESNAEANDDYKQYTSQIDKQVAEYKIYNEKLKKYYKENKPGEQAQDVIDKTIIAREYDNY